MNKKIELILVVLLSSIVIIGCARNRYLPAVAEIPDLGPRPTLKEVLKQEYMDDFLYMYDILDRHYPLFEISKRERGEDWRSKKNDFQTMISEVNSDREFREAIMSILGELNNGHTNLLIEGGYAQYFYSMLYTQPRNSWYFTQRKVFEQDNVRARYDLTNESIDHYVEQLNPTSDDTIRNIRTYDIIDGKVGYISVQDMLTVDDSERFRQEEQQVKEYLNQVKDYPALILDVRGNSGGMPEYWTKFILALLIENDISTDHYYFMRTGEKFAPLVDHFHPLTENDLDTFAFPQETIDVIANTDMYTTLTLSISPREDSINYKGNLYLLVDSKTYSSADTFAIFAKEKDIATVIGSKTGGGGVGFGMIFFDLPNTGYLVSMTPIIGVTEQGIISEMDKTQPNYEVNPLRMMGTDGKLILERDRAVQQVLRLEKLLEE